MIMKKIIQELRTMVKRKFISEEIFELLTQLPAEKLKEVCAALMYNIVFIQADEVKKLLQCKTDKSFEKELKNIKNKIENENIDGQIKQLQYILCKLIGYMNLRKKDEELQEEIYDAILTEVLYPLSEWLKAKKSESKVAESCFNILKNEIFY